MRRAEVFSPPFARADTWRAGRWVVETTCGPWDKDRDRPIAQREESKQHRYAAWFPTHTEALAHALAEVGLTEKNTEKETSR